MESMGGSCKWQTFKVGFWSRASNTRNVLFKIGESADIQSDLSSKALLLIVRVIWDYLGFPDPGSLHSFLVGQLGTRARTMDLELVNSERTSSPLTASLD